jgi:hypothetical protein
MRYKHKPCGHIGGYAGTQECVHVFEIEELRARREPESNYMYTILRALCRHFSDTIHVELSEPCPGCKFAGIKFPKPEPEADTGGSEAEGSERQSGRRVQ